MRERRSLFVMFAIVLLVAATASAGPGERAERRWDAARMPQLTGHSFAADVGARQAGMRAILNLDGNMLTLYAYDSEKHSLRTLYAVAVDVTGEPGKWNVTLAQRGVSFEMLVGEDGGLTIDGERTLMNRVVGERDRPVREPRADCTGSESALTSESGPKDPAPELANCVLRYILEGCCSSCICTHLELGVPRILDLACCGFGC